MKLINLFEYTFPKIKYRNTPNHPTAFDRVGNKTANRLRNSKDIEHLGTGSFASTYTNPNRTPHDVRKASKQMERQHIDGFYFYIRALENNPDNTNPYFPRFREITIYTDKFIVANQEDSQQDKITYSVQMERLYRLIDISESEYNAILYRILGPDISDNTSIELNDMVRRVIVSGRKHYNIIDEDFYRATKFISKVAENSNVWLDVHNENIMFRRTSYGPQLVITDPLGYRK